MLRTRIAMSLVLAAGAVLGPAPAQQYVISTYAGGGPPPERAQAMDASIGSVLGVTMDTAGNVYFSSSEFSVIFKLEPGGVLTRIVGNGRAGYSGDGGPAAAAQLNDPRGVAVDGAGNLFIADYRNSRIRKVSPDGIIATVAGGGGCCFAGDGGPATSAHVSFPVGVAVDGAGNVFIADTGNQRIRRVSPDGIITTLAGDGTEGFSGDGGPATSAALSYPNAVAVDSERNLFIADFGNHRIRRISPDGIITTVAGNGTRGFSGDGGPATSAPLSAFSLATDSESNLFIVDDNRIRKISPSGIINTVAGTSTGGFSGDGGPATSASLSPGSVAADAEGNLFIADVGNKRIRKVSASGVIGTVAGNGAPGVYFYGDGGPATAARLYLPTAVALDGTGNLFITDFANGRIRKVSPDGVITTVAGNGMRGFSGDGGPATSAALWPGNVAVDAQGNLFITDIDTQRVRKVSTGGIITTVAGNGMRGFSGDGGPATSAALNYPYAVAVDSERNLFIVDGQNHRVRKVSPSGIITTVAGNGMPGLSGDGGPATSAEMSPRSVAVDVAGNLFIVDIGNEQIPVYGATNDRLSQVHRIRRVSPDGIITTVAGGGSARWGDGGPATSAEIRFPYGVAVDGAGNLFFTISGVGVEGDIRGPERVRKVSPSGIITTVAGGGTAFPVDGGPAITASLSGPTGLAADSAGNVYVADTYRNVVRLLRPTNRSVLTVAVADAASQRADPVSPGKIVVIYGAGLGPSVPVRNQPRDGRFSTEFAGTTVSFNGIASPILYTSATQVAAVAPYALTGATAQVTVTYQGEASNPFTVPVAVSAPSLFTLNQTGAGQAAAINAVDGTVNTAANPVKLGGFISLYTTGDGQTTPAGMDGSIMGATLPRPVLPVSVTVGGISATLQYAGGAPGQVAGLMQVNVQIPRSVQPGGYVPVVLQAGDRTSGPAVWIAVSGN
jgi:trimeric autotransporter adhesin